MIGAAVHSVRAVPRDQIGQVADWARPRRAPLHVHLSEQVAENDACRDAYAVTPTALLADCGALGPRTTAVHATHLSPADVRAARRGRQLRLLLPDHRARPRRRHRPVPRAARRRRAADARLRQPRGDRPVRGDARGRARRAARHAAARALGGEELLDAATVDGHASLGFADAGSIAVGARADLVTLATDTPRTAGTGPTRLETVVFAATAADVRHVVVGGRVVYTPDDHPRSAPSSTPRSEPSTG